VSVTDRVRDVVLPLLDDRHLGLYDLEMQGPLLRLVVDSSGSLDLDVLADATRAVSRALDEADLIAGRYTLEVTSPGLERALRRPEHFERAVGEMVKVRTLPGHDERRVSGELTAADATGVTIRTGLDDEGRPVEHRLAYDEIERARTVFEWGPATPRTDARPGDSGRGGRSGRSKARRPAQRRTHHETSQKAEKKDRES
jgi:ribosome maturation factor RimP